MHFATSASSPNLRLVEAPSEVDRLIDAAIRADASRDGSRYAALEALYSVIEHFEASPDGLDERLEAAGIGIRSHSATVAHRVISLILPDYGDGRRRHGYRSEVLNVVVQYRATQGGETLAQWLAGPEGGFDRAKRLRREALGRRIEKGPRPLSLEEMKRLDARLTDEDRIALVCHLLEALPDLHVRVGNGRTVQLGTSSIKIEGSTNVCLRIA